MDLGSIPNQRRALLLLSHNGVMIPIGGKWSRRHRRSSSKAPGKGPPTHSLPGRNTGCGSARDPAVPGDAIRDAVFGVRNRADRVEAEAVLTNVCHQSVVTNLPLAPNRRRHASLACKDSDNPTAFPSAPSWCHRRRAASTHTTQRNSPDQEPHQKRPLNS